MGVRVAGLIHISTSTITTNTLSMILKIRVDGLLRPKSTSYTITTYITPIITIITTYITPIITMITIYYSLITIKQFVNRTRTKWETQKFTTTTSVMVGIMAGMTPISTSTINTNYLSTISTLRVDIILRPISTSDKITTLITPMLTYKIAR